MPRLLHCMPHNCVGQFAITGLAGNELHGEAAQGVLPGVGQHSGAHAAAPLRENSKKQTEDGDDDGGFGALIEVAGSESDGGEEYANVDAMRPGNELFLQIAAEESFFAKARRDGEGDPQDEFE